MFYRPLSSRKRIFHGKAVVDGKTKRLIHRIRPGEIAVIDHVDLDGVAAEALIKKKVHAVVNAAASISGKYPARGAELLLQAGIPLLDAVGPTVMELVKEKDWLYLHSNRLYRRRKGEAWIQVATGYRMTWEYWEERMAEATHNLHSTLSSFVDNTLQYAQRERVFVNRPLPVPALFTRFRNRDVLIAVRGGGHEQDLKTLRSFIKEKEPILIGVDGGADTLLQEGFSPHIILGDMDSVTDQALASGAELVVHAYPDGTAPGLHRVEQLGLAAHLIPFPGTSEDVAMLLAYQEGARRIIMLGSHSNVVDFMEKGRKGMASTMLARMKVGEKLVDAKGVTHLYRNSDSPRVRDVLLLGFAALTPVIAFAIVNPHFDHIVRILWLNVKTIFSWA